MCDNSKLMKQLRSAIGATVDYDGQRCTVVELLEQPFCLIIESLDARTTMQDNLFGSPQRRVTKVFTIPCLNDSGGGGLHPELLSLGLQIE